jgi:transposase InsO family protein
MSRKGNCLDNVPMESFLAHMKDEMEYKHAMSFGELVEIINSYMSGGLSIQVQHFFNKCLIRCFPVETFSGTVIQ